MSKITPFPSAAGSPTTEGSPSADQIISGSPTFKTWVHFQDGSMRSGEWEVMPGSWKVVYSRWEFMHILSGSGTLHSEDGKTITLKPGVSLVTQPGFRGHWIVTETIRKAFFVREEAAV